MPLFLAGGEHGEVIDAYKFFAGTGRQRLQPDRHDRRLRPRDRDRADPGQRDPQPHRRAAAGHDPWGGDSLEWFALSPPEPHNFDVLPDVRSDRPMRDIREAIAHSTERAERSRRASRSR